MANAIEFIKYIGAEIIKNNIEARQGGSCL